MLYPLLKKELREKRIAIVTGIIWVVAPLLFWFQWANIHVHAIPRAIMTGAAMLAPGVTMLLLACAPFFMERRNNTWEYLLALPIARRKIIFAKWIVPLALGMFFMTLSSAISWFPITRMETSLIHVGLPQWICLHVAGAMLLMSILLLLDSLDWGEWLGLRAIVSFALIAVFIFSMQVSGRSITWSSIIWNLAISAISMAAAILAAPVLTAESPFPQWRLKRRITFRRFSSDGAWVWLHWRRARPVIILLLMPVPLLLMVQMLAVGFQGDLSHARQLFSELVFSDVAVWPLSALMCICAALLGAVTAMVEGNTKSIQFRWALPLSRKRAQRLRLLFALAVLVLIYMPNLLLLAARANYLGHTYNAVLVSSVAMLSLMACICATSLSIGSFANARPGFYGLTTVAAGLCGLVYVINNLTGTKALSLTVSIPAAFAIVAAAWYLLPQIEKQRLA